MSMKILLPVDGSLHALQAVKHALALVRAGLKAEFVLANVQPHANLYEVVTAHDAELIDQVRSAAGADELQGAEALLSGAGVEWESEVVGGEPSRMLLEMIERYGCSAVIMGAHGTGALRELLTGSVSGELVRHSAVPVTLVRAAVLEEAG